MASRGPALRAAHGSRRDLLKALARLDPPAVVDDDALTQFVRARQELIDALRNCEPSVDDEAEVMILEAVAKTKPILAALDQERAVTARQLAGLHQSRQRLRQLGASPDTARLLSRQA